MSIFLRALAGELDAGTGVAGRDALLRAAGHRMALLAPLSPVASLEALGAEMNAALDLLGWGRTQVTLHEADRAVLFNHAGLPPVGGAGEPAGAWLAGALEGLYEGWMAAQPGAEPGLVARRLAGGGPDRVVIRYARR